MNDFISYVFPAVVITEALQLSIRYCLHKLPAADIRDTIMWQERIG